jgi:hypothetical protein
MLIEGFADIRDCEIKIVPTEKSIEIKLHNHQGSLCLSLSKSVSERLHREL